MPRYATWTTQAHQRQAEPEMNVACLCYRKRFRDHSSRRTACLSLAATSFIPRLILTTDCKGESRFNSIFFAFR